MLPSSLFPVCMNWSFNLCSTVCLNQSMLLHFCEPTTQQTAKVHHLIGVNSAQLLSISIILLTCSLIVNLHRRPANPDPSLPSNPVPADTASPPQPSQMAPSVSVSKSLPSFAEWTDISVALKTRPWMFKDFFVCFSDDLPRWVRFHHSQPD